MKRSYLVVFLLAFAVFAAGCLGAHSTPSSSTNTVSSSTVFSGSSTGTVSSTAASSVSSSSSLTMVSGSTVVSSSTVSSATDASVSSSAVSNSTAVSSTASGSSTTASGSSATGASVSSFSFEFGGSYVLTDYLESESFSYRGEVTYLLTWNSSATQTLVLAYPGDTFVITKSVDGSDYVYYVTSYQYYDHTLTTRVVFFDANKLTQGVYVVVSGSTSGCTPCAASLSSVLPETLVIPSFSSVFTSGCWRYASTVLTRSFQGTVYTYTVYYSVCGNTLVMRVVGYVYDLYAWVVAR